MRFSLITVAIAAALSLSACSNNQTADGTDAANTNTTATTATGTTANAPTSAGYQSPENVSMNITGAGASFPAPIYSKWAADFSSMAGGQVNYQSIGSSGGVAQITERTVDFGATDSPLTQQELDELGMMQFPTVIGGVVPIINVDGIEPGAMVLSGEVLADIYLGNITKWNDPALAALNPNLTLPDANITTVYRSDGSGTTFNFTNYLEKTSSRWAAGPGSANSISWPTSNTGAGGRGNEGVASTVGRVANSIGYVEYAYAKENNLSHTAMINAAGNTVQPSAETFAAAGDVDWSQHPGNYLILTNSETDQAWPIAAATFILVYKQPQNPENTAGVLNFFNWAFEHGDDAALSLDYVPFSDTAKDLFRGQWDQVVGADGQPVFRAVS